MPDLLVRSAKEIKLHHYYNTPLHALPKTFNIDDMILMICLCVCVRACVCVCVCVCACVCFIDVNPRMVIITRMANTGSHLLQSFP